MARLILASGAVIALAANQPRARQFVERALRERTLLIVPAVVIAETTRGGQRDARVNRILKAVHEITPVTEALAREAGRLLATVTNSHLTVDALIVAEAVLHGPAIILASDLEDLSALAANRPGVWIYGI